MRWTKIEEIYGEALKHAYGFNNPETSQSYWTALHKSVTEHVKLNNHIYYFYYYYYNYYKILNEILIFFFFFFFFN